MLVSEGIVSGTKSGKSARHGTHGMSSVGILEAGGPKGSRAFNEHEFTYPGLYTCPDGELSPLAYATRARIVMDHDLDYKKCHT